MANEVYKRQVSLLLSVIPEVAKEACFALHGGTAINLFIRNMPRLSVDIDLTYIPIEDRETSFRNISAALERIKGRVKNLIPRVKVNHKEDIGKLLISANGSDIKLEVNLTNRGLLGASVNTGLCLKAQDEFDAFCAIDIVSSGQLYGGKICAALDRQHPRDLFDIKYLLENEGFTNEIRRGFLLFLLCSARPINEILAPKFQDQRAAMKNQFTGMSEDGFSYEEFEAVREKLVKTIHENLTAKDKEFLLGFKNLKPDWSIHDFQQFPAIAWKLRNLQNLKDNNPDKHQEMYATLEKLLNSIGNS